MNTSHAFFTHSSVHEHLGWFHNISHSDSNLVNRCLWNADVYPLSECAGVVSPCHFSGIREASTPISTVTRLVYILTRSVYSGPFVQVRNMCFHDDRCSDWDMRESECSSNLHEYDGQCPHWPAVPFPLILFTASTVEQQVLFCPTLHLTLYSMAKVFFRKEAVTETLKPGIAYILNYIQKCLLSPCPCLSLSPGSH